MPTGKATPLPTAREVLLLHRPADEPSSRVRGVGAARPWRATLLNAVLALAMTGGAVWLRAYVEERVATAPPPVRVIDVYRLIVDDTPVPVTVTAGWEKVTEWTTHEAVRSDPTLWRRMHVDDWDGVPSPLRERALESMLTRYRSVLASPSTWDRMGAADWDLIPQPIRALAYRHMTEYWAGYYDVGGAYAIPRGLMADTLAAIIMSESWFEHRAENRNAWGNRDWESPKPPMVRVRGWLLSTTRDGSTSGWPMRTTSTRGTGPVHRILDGIPPGTGRWRPRSRGACVPSRHERCAGWPRCALPARSGGSATTLYPQRRRVRSVGLPVETRS